MQYIHQYISHSLPRYQFSNISTRFLSGRGRLADIKKNQSLWLELAMEWNGAAGPLWACGSLCHTGVDVWMARCPLCVTPVRRDGRRTRRKEDRDLRRADRQCSTHYRMTSSHQSPGNREVTGARSVGGGSVENVTGEEDTARRRLNTGVKHW